MKKSSKQEAVAPKPEEQIARLTGTSFPRNAPSPDAAIVTRKYTLESSLGDVVVTVRGPRGAMRLQSTHETLTIATGKADAEVPEPTRVTRRVAPPREMSGNINEPGGTSVDSLPGDDDAIERKASAITAESLKFLKDGERSMLRSE